MSPNKKGRGQEKKLRTTTLPEKHLNKLTSNEI